MLNHMEQPRFSDVSSTILQTVRRGDLRQQHSSPTLRLSEARLPSKRMDAHVGPLTTQLSPQRLNSDGDILASLLSGRQSWNTGASAIKTFDDCVPVYKSLSLYIWREVTGALTSRTISYTHLTSLSIPFFRDVDIWSTWDNVENIIQHKLVRNALRAFAEGALGPLGVAGTQAVDAEDLRHFGQIVESVLDSEEDKTKLMSVQGEAAATVLDLLQTLVDRLPSESTLRRRFERALNKISLNSGCLPQYLFLDDVTSVGKEPFAGGGFADVWRGSYKAKNVALKRLRIFTSKEERDKLLKELLREALIWRQLSHPFVHPFYGVSRTVFDPHFCLVSPWMDAGTVMEFLQTNPNANRRLLLFRIAKGLCYLHNLDPHVVHGDLRGANILVNSDGWPQITDFGLAHIADSQATTIGPATWDGKGATRWLAPELLNDFSPLDMHSDIYAFGCVCLEVFTGKPPFSDLPERVIPLAVRQGRKFSRPSEDANERGLDDSLWSIMEQCWNLIPADRPRMAQVIDLMRIALGESCHVSNLDGELNNWFRDEDFRHSLSDLLVVPKVPTLRTTTTTQSSVIVELRSAHTTEPKVDVSGQFLAVPVLHEQALSRSSTGTPQSIVASKVTAARPRRQYGHRHTLSEPVILVNRGDGEGVIKGRDRSRSENGGQIVGQRLIS